MLERIRYKFTHLLTGKTYVTKNYYLDAREAMKEDEELYQSLPEGELTYEEYTDNLS